VIAYYRRWAWDEADRELDLLPHERRIPIAEDLTDELAVNLAFLVLSSSILIFRLETSNSFFVTAGADLSSPVRYVLLEVLQAFPFLGNIEVLDLPLSSGLGVRQPLGGMATFGLRSVFDILVIGGVISLFKVARAAATGADLSRLIDRIEHNPAQTIAELAARASAGLTKADSLLERFALAPQSETNLPFGTRLQAAAAIGSLGERFIVGGIGRLQLASAALNNLASEILDIDRPAWREVVELRSTLQVILSERLPGQAAIDARELGILLMEELGREVAESSALNNEDNYTPPSEGSLHEEPGETGATETSSLQGINHRMTTAHYPADMTMAARRDDLDDAIAAVDASLEDESCSPLNRASLLISKGGLLLKRGHLEGGAKARDFLGMAGLAMEQAADHAEEGGDDALMCRAVIGSCHVICFLAPSLQQSEATGALHQAQERLGAVSRMMSEISPALAAEARKVLVQVDEVLRGIGRSTPAKERLADMERDLKTITPSTHFRQYVALQAAVSGAKIELSQTVETRTEALFYIRSAVGSLRDALGIFPAEGDRTDKAVLLNNLCRTLWVLGENVEDAAEQIEIYLQSVEAGTEATAIHEASGSVDMAMGSLTNLGAATMLLSTTTDYKDRHKVLVQSISASRKAADYFRDTGQTAHWLSAESNCAKAALFGLCERNDLDGLYKLVASIDVTLSMVPDDHVASSAALLKQTRNGAVYVIESATGRPYKVDDVD